MASEEKPTGLVDSQKPTLNVPLIPPPPGMRQGEARPIPASTLPEGYVSFEKVDPKDKDAVQEAARKWMEAQSTRSCLS